MSLIFLNNIMKTWLYFSNKFLFFSLAWSFIFHILVIFFISQHSDSHAKKNNESLISSVILDAKNHSYPPDISSQFQDFSDEVSTSSPGEISSDSFIDSSISMPVYTEDQLDKPAEPLNKNLSFDFEYYPENVDISKALLIIKLWITPKGNVEKFEIISTQLDEILTKKMAAQIGSQPFYPAIKDNKGVSSTKIYSIGSEIE